MDLSVVVFVADCGFYGHIGLKKVPAKGDEEGYREPFWSIADLIVVQMRYQRRSLLNSFELEGVRKP